MAHGPMDLALARARLERPYFATALARLTLRKNTAIPTARVTDRWVLEYNPEFIAEWQAECGLAWGLVLHELDHLRRKHLARAKGLSVQGPIEAAFLNLAEDFEINDDLLAEKVPLHSSRAIASDCAKEWAQHYAQRGEAPPPALKKLAAYGDGGVMERYYAILQELAPPLPEELPCYGVVAEGDGKGDAEGEGEADGPVSEAEAELIWRHVAEKTREYASQEKNRGKVPQKLLDWAEEMLAPSPIPWRELLVAHVRRAFAERSGASDYTRKKPCRRQNAYGRVLLPGLYEPLPRVAVVFDTSGSMDTHELAQGRAEILQILKTTGVPCTVLDVDAAVHAVRDVRGSADVRQVGRQGRGGTDMRVGIDAAMELRPDMLIVYTDGGTLWPNVPTRCPMIVLLSPNGHPHGVPSWARLVRVDTFGKAA